MDYIEAKEKLREAKLQALANSCNIKVGRRELEVALDALSKPNMREKVKEYIYELDVEIDRCKNTIEETLSSIEDDEAKEVYCFSVEYITLKSRMITLTEVRNDLKGRLEELV